jgi:hypothetical protein
MAWRPFFINRLSHKRVLAQCNGWAQPLKQTSEDLCTAKMLSAGFEPTTRETDFDSVLATPWLKTSYKDFQGKPSRRDSICVPVDKKPWHWQVSNLHWRNCRDRFRFCSSCHFGRTKLRWTARKPLMNECSRRVLTEEKCLQSAGFEPTQSRRNRFWFCCGDHLAKTS